MRSLVPGTVPGRTLQAEEVDGFFGADSMVRRLHRERPRGPVLFSGVRARLMQACDPLAVVYYERIFGSLAAEEREPAGSAPPRSRRPRRSD